MTAARALPLRTGPLRRQARLGRDHVHAEVPAPRAPAGARRARRADGAPPSRPCCAGASSSSARAARSRPRPSRRSWATSTTGPSPTPAGTFACRCPPAPRACRSSASEHHTFVQKETIAAGQELVVKYLIERERYNLNETVVVAERRRDEVSRVTLRGDEIQKIPGTSGTLRLIWTLPGVSSIVSLLPVPGRARVQPQLDGLPARRHAHPAAVPPAVRAQRRSPRAHRRDPVLPRRRAGAVRRLRGRHRRRPHAARAPGRAPRSTSTSTCCRRAGSSARRLRRSARR